LQEFKTDKPSNSFNHKVNGRCGHKNHGSKCGERAYGKIDDQKLCKKHYENKIRFEREFKNID
jgi:hypothetical protein